MALRAGICGMRRIALAGRVWPILALLLRKPGSAWAVTAESVAFFFPVWRWLAVVTVAGIGVPAGSIP